MSTSSNKAVSRVVAAFLALPEQDQRKCAEHIAKLSGNGFMNMPLFPMFPPNGSASPPPPQTAVPTPVPTPVAFLEEQQNDQNEQNQQEVQSTTLSGASKWADRSRLEAVKESPSNSMRVQEKGAKGPKTRTLPQGSSSICDRPDCGCFGFPRQEAHPGWDPQKVAIFCTLTKHHSYTFDQLRDLAQVAVGGIRKRKQLVEKTFAYESKDGDEKPPRIDITCRSHAAAVQALWNIWEARERLGIGVNWGFQYHPRHQEDEDEDRDSQQEQQDEEHE